ncbi:ankyrin repeat domain-containing protein [Candidatus Tisiphia endosymbiont of Nemotelus uliginosus]|uniref:ankyrin repeat domain-containing protein n=1 Tax=Candidatus Tisiphia endosymbiont of Nemotelus uliginosus TaxID=3077926 RepID=UPI0035C8F39A
MTKDSRQNAVEFIAAIQFNINNLKDDILPLQYEQQVALLKYVKDELKNWKSNDQEIRDLEISLPKDLQILDQELTKLTIDECKSIIGTYDHFYKQVLGISPETSEIEQYNKEWMQLLEKNIGHIETQQNRIKELAGIEQDKKLCNQKVDEFLNQDFEPKQDDSGQEDIFLKLINARYEREDQEIRASRRPEDQKEHIEAKLQQRRENREKDKQEKLSQMKEQWEHQSREEYKFAIKLYNINLQLKDVDDKEKADKLSQEKQQLINEYNKKLEQASSKQIAEEVRQKQADLQKKSQPNSVDMADHPLVREGILRPEEVKLMATNHETLEAWRYFNTENFYNNLKKLWNITRNYYRDNQEQGPKELAGLSHDKAIDVVKPGLLEKLKNKRLSSADFVYTATRKELEGFDSVKFDENYTCLEDYALATGVIDTLKKIIEDDNRKYNRPVEALKIGRAIFTNNTQEIEKYKIAGTKLDITSSEPLLNGIFRANSNLPATNLPQIISLIDLAAKNRDNNTILHIAARNGYLELAEESIKLGADINAQGRLGNTPLMIAINMGHLELANKLIELGANINAKGQFFNTPLIMAIEEGHLEIANRLIDKGADVHAKGQVDYTPLHIAARNGYLELTERLIKKYKVDINAKDMDDYTPLILAIQEGRLEVANKLIDLRADIKVKGQDNYTVLHTAARKGYVELAETFIELGIDVNTKTTNDNTPLHVAAIDARNVSMVKKLIDKKSTIDARDKQERSALHIAVFNNCLEIVKVLITGKSDVNAIEQVKKTPLHYAAEMGYLPIVQELIKSEANINPVDKDDNTPLHLATKRQDAELEKELIKELIEWGADINAKNQLGEYALSSTMIQQEPEMIFQAIMKNIRKDIPQDIESNSIIVNRLTNLISELEERKAVDNNAAVVGSLLEKCQKESNKQLVKQVKISPKYKNEGNTINIGQSSSKIPRPPSPSGRGL